MDVPVEEEQHSSRVPLSLNWFPIASIVVIFGVIAVVVVLYARDPPVQPGLFPTISITATLWPGDRLFAIGLGVAAILLFVNFSIVADQFQLANSTGLSRTILVLSLISSILLALVGLFNMQDSLTAHNTISFVAFLILIAAMAVMVVGEIRIQREKFTSLKLSCIAIAFWNLLGMAALTRVEETPIRFSLLGICEYLVLLGTVVVIGLFYHTFRQVQVIFSVELGEQTAETTTDGVENPPIVVTADL
jgi:hypothetical membrane protein